MEATLQIISNFGNIRDMIVLNRLSILFGELKLDLVSEKELDEKVHNFTIFFIFKEVICKHFHTACYQQFTATFVLVNGCDRSVAWISEWT